METPLSARKVTGSNGLLHSVKIDNSDMSSAKSVHTSADFHQDRSALIDITNDSPIVGLSMGNLDTPSSKKKMFTPTPGSGEALLRGQVKTLLQKIEEGTEISKESRPIFMNCYSSPINPVAPTPANTPQTVTITSDSGNSDSGLPSCTTPVTENLQITRSLMPDFSDKSESSDLIDCEKKLPIEDDGSSSIWSIQANAASSTRDEEEEEVYEEDDEYLLNEVCNEMQKITFGGGLPKFTGKHIRFVYNSDDEMIAQQQCECCCEEGVPSC